MNFKNLVLISSVFCVLIEANALLADESDPGLHKQKQQVLSQFLNKVLSERVARTATVGFRGDGCFEAYEKKQTSITNQYDKQHHLCIETAEKAAKKHSEESAEKRLEILKQGDNICNDLSSCEVHPEDKEFFECYTSASKKNHPILYDISVTSSAQELSMQVQQMAIINEKTNCTTLAFQSYINGLRDCNKDLQTCLKDPPKTTTQPPMESTTQPTESTIEPDLPTTQPTESTTQTDEPTTLPTEPTEEPSEPTGEPSEPTAEPSEPTEEPSEPTEEPSEPTEEPSEPTEKPSEPTEEPSEPTEEPSEPTEEPSEPTEEPSEPTEEPSKPTEEPSESTEDPSKPTEKPSEPTEEPSEPTEEPSEPTTEPSTTEDPMPEEDLDMVRRLKR